MHEIIYTVVTLLGNRLKELKPELFFPLKNLEKLTLNRNQLSELPEEIFQPGHCQLKARVLKAYYFWHYLIIKIEKLKLNS